MKASELIQDLEKQLGIADLPEIIKQETMSRLTKSLIELTLIEVTDSISEEEAKTLNEALDNGKGVEVLNTLLDAHPELEEKIANSIKDALSQFTNTDKEPSAV